MKEELKDIDILQQDNHNFNKGTEAGEKLMKKSFEQFGAGRSVLVDKDNRIIAGNKSAKAAASTGITKVRIIETDGTELIAVKRTDVSLDSKEGRQMALADNATTQVNLSWDEAQLQEMDKQYCMEVPEWGVELPDIQEYEKEIKEDDYDENNEKIAKLSKYGDLWKLGRHYLMCGDSTKSEDLLTLMGGGADIRESQTMDYRPTVQRVH